MKGWLVLETGEVYQGAWHGGENRAGEVVFNTSHSGYEEIATDPSYFSQIVVMTAPMQGNYGIEDAAWESRQLWIEGFICLEVQDTERDQAWKKRLIGNKIPMLTELDTRHLVLRLRKGGTPWGALVQAADESQAKAIAQDLIGKKKTLDKDWVYLASRPAPEVRRGDTMVGPRVAVLDFGSKENILRELQNRCSEIKIFNSRSTVQEIMEYNPDGIMLTNGPGDPADVKVAIGTVKELLGVKPIFGICMGHQILGLALGGKTYKLKFGHRGSNHPIQDQILNQIYMTSQNHGYAVDPATLPEDVKVTHTNLNDGTVAGFYSEKRKCLGIQYHPESCPGPHEASGLFSYFVERMI
ncbi:glutamine-hydrolyzing carbamoyl-phosphate synthase small subunit [Bdellovibrio sp. GT3]|uniref:glutamine-hydrolyzing carbamoyl-phosphate synthase small subunit n=1 Tax=Bdellovibrio sp. GT3 TaxID=3136282 RepID=UPI0030F1C440